MFPEDGVVARYKRDTENTKIRPEDLRRFIESRKRTLEWDQTGATLGDLGFAQLLLASTEEGSDSLSSDLLRGARNSLENGLARAPMDPHGWTQLAYARILSGVEDIAVLAALRMSILTGPYEPRLVYPRLKLLLNYWKGFSAEEKQMIYRQIRFGWDVSRSKLVEIAAPLELEHVNAFRVALAYDPSFLLSFERRLKWARIRAKQDEDG